MVCDKSLFITSFIVHTPSPLLVSLTMTSAHVHMWYLVVPRGCFLTWPDHSSSWEPIISGATVLRMSAIEMFPFLSSRPLLTEVTPCKRLFRPVSVSPDTQFSSPKYLSHYDLEAAGSYLEHGRMVGAKDLISAEIAGSSPAFTTKLELFPGRP